MASKGVIRIGDPLSSGGQVVSACSQFKVDGKEVAGVGDACQCRRHGDVKIVEGVETFTYFGKKLALDGCKASCGCTVISTTSQMVVAP